VLLLANPSKPTGTIYGNESLSALYDYLSPPGSTLVVEEIYSGLFYDKKPVTALTISDDIIVVNGFSKTFAMTGFRLGWMVVPEPLVRPLQRCAQNLFISPPSISQYAALGAFDNPHEIENMRKTYEERRNYMLPRLKALGFSIPINPSGAFYIYAGIEKWNLDSMDFVNRALVEARVAITPGYDFGQFEAGSHVRFSYTEPIDKLSAGCNRLELWLGSL
jgi:aspartate/methionine/tyrosine aminotransferase